MLAVFAEPHARKCFYPSVLDCSRDQELSRTAEAHTWGYFMTLDTSRILNLNTRASYQMLHPKGFFMTVAWIDKFSIRLRDDHHITDVVE